MADLKFQNRVNVQKGTRRDPKLEIDLKEIFRQRIANRDLRDEIGQKILDLINKRTASGEGLDGTFKPYSKEYRTSREFKAFGKSPGKVNLSLTGDMMGLMDVIESSSSKIKIGWDSADEAAKAHGHIVGADLPNGKKLPKRDFFGLTDSELAELRAAFKDKINESE